MVVVVVVAIVVCMRSDIDMQEEIHMIDVNMRDMYASVCVYI